MAPQHAAHHGAPKKWSADVTKHSNALDLEEDVFESDDPRKIALSLKRSAERSKRRKAEPYQSAMSMLTFYINRAGKNLSARQKKVLDRAKDELREVFGRDE
jgi:hypothetical protein